MWWVNRARKVSVSRKPVAAHFNVLDLNLASGVEPPSDSVAGGFFSTSSCGLCGKASTAAVRTRSTFDVHDDGLSVTSMMLASLPGLLRTAQKVFVRTGGLHTAALFSAAGELLVLREEVGRHEAVEKVIGWVLREGRLPLLSTTLLVSGRASFELVKRPSLPVFGRPARCSRHRRSWRIWP